MISCTEFIPAYSELFCFLEETGGRQAVLDYWEYVAKNGLPELERLVSEHGLEGCFLYWSRTLTEEAADFTLTLDEENRTFTLEMESCPSKKRLLSLEGMTPYPDYCGHCDVLYRRVMEKAGLSYFLDLSEADKARCRIVISDKNPLEESHESSHR